MKGFERYQKLIAEWVSDRLGPYMGAETKTTMPAKLEHFGSKLVFEFTDISETMDALHLAQTLVSVAPPRSKKIQRDEYLKYQVNAYLQEIYMLKERLISYQKKLSRAYKHHDHATHFEKCTDELPKLVNDTLKEIVNTRGDHVHVARFSHRDLDFLSQLDLVARFDERFKKDANFDYWQAKRQWSERMKHNNKQAMEMLNEYFSAMEKAITENGKIVVPCDVGI